VASDITYIRLGKGFVYLAVTMGLFTRGIRGWNLSRGLDQRLTLVVLRRAHQRRLRTSNYLERFSQEIKRRTRIARVFPNEQSCVRLVSAILMDVGEKWEYGRIYLRMETG